MAAILPEAQQRLISYEMSQHEEIPFEDKKGLSLYMAAAYGLNLDGYARRLNRAQLRHMARRLQRYVVQGQSFLERLVLLNNATGGTVIPLYEGRLPCPVKEFYNGGEDGDEDAAQGYADQSIFVNATETEDGVTFSLLRWPRAQYHSHQEVLDPGLIMVQSQPAFEYTTSHDCVREFPDLL